MEPFLSLSFSEAIWCAIVLFAAACIRGFSGFGFTAVLMAGLATTLPITQIVPLSIALEIAASAGQAPGILRDVNWRKLGILLATGFVGTPLGVFLLGTFSDQALRVIVLMFISTVSVYLIFSRRPPARFSIITYAVAGFAIGVTNGATALSGLVLALFFSRSGDRPAQIRATMIAYLFAADIWAGGMLLGSGFYDSVTWTRVMVALPILGLGIWLGSRQFTAVTPDGFRMFVLWLLLALSILGLVVFQAQDVF